MRNAKSPNSAAQTVRETSTGWMIKVLSSVLDEEMSRELKQLDLIQGHFAVLMTLLENEGQTQAQIGKKVLMPGYATTRNIDALESRKLVERRQNVNSRRSHSIYLTEKGRALAPRLFAIVERLNNRLLDALDPDERAQLTAILEKLVNTKLDREV